MHTVIVTVATAPSPFPAGTVSQGISISLGAAIPAQILAAAPYVASFSDVPAGDYIVTAQALAADGSNLGPAITAMATVAPDAVNVDLPASISVEVQ